MGARFTSGRERTVDRADRVRYPIGPPWTRQAFWYRTLAREGARPALEIARTMIDEMRDGRNSLLSGIAHRLMGVHDDGLVTRFKDDPLVGALIRSGFDAWVSGEPERSMALTERAVAEVEPCGHASTLCFRFFSDVSSAHPGRCCDARTPLSPREANAGWPASNRNPGRLPIGIGGRLRRNPQSAGASCWK